MDPVSYQRVRLWSGITSIGLNLGIIWSLAWISGFTCGEFTKNFVWAGTILLLIALGISLANLPFDLLVGNSVERFAARTDETTGQWLMDWVSLRLGTTAGLWVGMMIFLFMSTISTGSFLSLLGVLTAAIILLFLMIPAGSPAPDGSSEKDFQCVLERELKSLGAPQRQIRWHDNGDLETVNGCILPNGVLSLSLTVARMLAPREAALLAFREEYYRRSGMWLLNLGIVLGWTLCGIVLAKLYPAGNSIQAALGGAAIMTTWCFLALFIWPGLSRAWMRQADQFAVRASSASEVVKLLTKVESLNATDLSLSPAKTVVFHPIPPLNERLKHLL